MADANAEALGAMNAALGDAVTGGSSEEIENTTGIATEGDDGVQVDDTGNDGGDTGDTGADEPQVAAEGDEAPEGVDAAKDSAGKDLVRDPATGRFVAKPVEKDDAAAAAAAAAAKDKDPAGKTAAAAAAAAAKKPDHVNDPIPTDLKPATQERIRSLVKTTKEVTAERDTVKRDFDYMIQGVQATGTTPEQYGEVLSFMALFNSQDAAQQEKALELIEGVADRLSTLLGKERTVGDPFAEHTDLREAVAKGQVTAQYAKEIARTRNQNKFRTELTTAASAQEQAATTAQRELDTARNDLNVLEQTLQATDPQYAAKKAQLMPILKPLFKTIPPSQWKPAFLEALKNVKVAAAPAARRAAPGQQPMRAGGGSGAGGGAGGNGSGGMNSGVTSAMDALNAGIAAARK